ncbi:MAG: peptidase U32 family protein [Gemmatimonadota bacterium]
MENRNGQARPILLAPAGSRAAVAAVLAAGADAVYAGAGAWGRGGARSGLSDPEIFAAAADCRAAGASLHVALNTVPAAADIPRFLASVLRLRDGGIETVILSDPGAIALVRRECLGTRICASVGASTLNPAEAQFYRELGADAVVLPAAIGREEVLPIKAASGLFVEVFAYGRPEFIIHGKCGLPGYLREAPPPPAAGAPREAGPAGGGSLASAKRTGRCHLVCRALPVPRAIRSIEDELREWADAGVDAFKIEGRDLPPERIAPIVSRFRRKLDAAIAESARAASRLSR